MLKRTEITITTESLLIVGVRRVRRSWCPRCEAEVEAFALEDVRAPSNSEPSAFEAWLTEDAFHRLTTGDSKTLICLNSLLAQAQKQQIR